MSPQFSLTGKPCVEVMLTIIASPTLALPSATDTDKNRMRLVKNLYMAMAGDSELSQLRDQQTEASSNQVLLINLDKWIKIFFLAAYKTLTPEQLQQIKIKGVLHTRMRTCTHARTHTHKRTRTHTLTRTRTPTPTPTPTGPTNTQQTRSA